MSRSGYFKDLGNFGQQIINQVASDIRSNAENLVYSLSQDQQQAQQQNHSHQSSRAGNIPEGISRNNSNSGASTPSERGTGGGGSDPRRRSSSTSSSQATTPEEVAGDWLNNFMRGSGSASTNCGTSMGNAGFCGPKHSSTVKPTDNQESTMFCDICQAKFTLFNRKKQCSECKSHFCGTCVTREAPTGRRGQSSLNSRTCKRCKILLSSPPIRAHLMDLRVKDLQRYLVSKKVNTKSCVEKKDLVELVIRQNCMENGTVPPPPPTSTTTTTTTTADGTSSTNVTQPPLRRKIPEERKKSFPNSYVQSTHRHEWLEKMENGSDMDIALNCDEDDDFVVVTPVQPMNTNDEVTTSKSDDEEVDNTEQTTTTTDQNVQEDLIEATPVEEIQIDPIKVDSDDDEKNSRDTVTPTVVEEEDERDEDNISTDVDDDNVQGAGALPHTGNVTQAETDNVEMSEKSEPVKITLPNSPTREMSGSPRRFANQGLVYLKEIQTLEEVQELSVKQAKDILAMNRVNFKGVVEKDELLKHVSRLWKQEHRAQAEKDNLEDSDLCKICMDNPVDCVMLECGHMCTCTTCGKQMAECPICRQYVVRVVRTFKA